MSYATAAEVKAYSALSAIQALSDDDLNNKYIPRAERIINSYCRQNFNRSNQKVILVDGSGGNRLELTERLVSLSQLRFIDGGAHSAQANGVTTEDFTVANHFSISDETKVEVSGGQAQLKNINDPVDLKTYPFTTPANYTFDDELIEVTGGVGKLKNRRPTDATFHANFNSDVSGNWGDGVLTGTPTGGAAIVGRKLNLSFDDLRYVTFGSGSNWAGTQVGCIRIKITPNYSGSPVTTQALFDLSDGSTNNNRILIFHSTDGNILARVSNPAGATLFPDEIFGAWSPTAGVEYEIEFNFDVTTGASRMFVDGIQLGATKTDTGTHTLAGLTVFRIGTNHQTSLNSNHKVDDFILFDSVQHTANYTPGAFIPETDFDTDAPTIVTNDGLLFDFALSILTMVSTVLGADSIKAQVSHDDSVTDKWWNGSAWAAKSTTVIDNLATEIRTITGTLDAGNLASIQTEDGSTYDVSEVAMTPGYLVEIDSANIQNAPSNIRIKADYTGAMGHTVNLDIFNFVTQAWDTLGQLAETGGTLTEQDFTVTGTPSDYLQKGEVKIRINHISAGNMTHDLRIDYVAFQGLPGSKWYYDNEVNTIADLQTNLSTLASSGTFQIKLFLKSDTGFSTPPEVDSVFVSNSANYSTNDNLYFETTDAGQIEPSNLLAWLSIVLTTLTPTGSDIRILFSLDGRLNWLTWDGSRFNAPADPAVRTNATSLEDAVDNFTELHSDAPMDYRIFLNTSDLLVRPVVSNIIFESLTISANATVSSVDIDAIFNKNWYLMADSEPVRARQRIGKQERLEDALIFPLGFNNIEITGYFGYSTVPDEVRDATAEVVERIVSNEGSITVKHGSFKKEKIGDYSYERDSAKDSTTSRDAYISGIAKDYLRNFRKPVLISRI